MTVTGLHIHYTMLFIVILECAIRKFGVILCCVMLAAASDVSELWHLLIASFFSLVLNLISFFCTVTCFTSL